MGMTPAKNRERKCSTCKHYQPSPLWRKGWCRNPLLYDRNTNHLVEGESLACNRTFIDYWEPLESPAAPGPLARSKNKDKEKPRVAPSITMNPVDARGNPLQGGNTPVSGTSAVAPAQVLELPTTREKRPLSLVQRSADIEGDSLLDDPKETQQISQVSGSDDAPRPGTTRQRIKAARAQGKPGGFMSRLPLSGVRLWIALTLIAALLVAAGGGYALTRKTVTPVVVPTAVATHPVPTPTGFGDATATTPPQPTVVKTAGVAVAPGVIAVNGYAQVSGSKSGLSLRSTPSKTGSKLRVLTDGTKAHVIDGPKDADGFTWWKIDSFDPAQPSLSGWCVSAFLIPASAP